MSVWKDLFSSFQIPFPEIILIDEKNRTLFTQCTQPFEHLHMASSAENLLRFIKPKKDEIFLTNDLSAGCLCPEDFYFLFEITHSSQGQIFALVRKNFISPGKIPPFPLFSGGKVQQEFLQAVCQNHPAAQVIQNFLVKTFDQINQFKQRFEKILKQTEFLAHKETYFREHQSKCKAYLSEKPYGQSSTSLALNAQNLLRLKVHLDEENVLFDFSGSSKMSKYGWPESLTTSFAFGFFAETYQLPKPYHHSHFSMFHTSYSPGSIVSANLKEPQNFEYLKIRNALLQVLQKTLCNIHKKPAASFWLTRSDRIYFMNAGDLFEAEFKLSSALETSFHLRRNGTAIPPHAIFNLFEKFSFDLETGLLELESGNETTFFKPESLIGYESNGSNHVLKFDPLFKQLSSSTAE